VRDALARRAAHAGDLAQLLLYSAIMSRVAIFSLFLLAACSPGASDTPEAELYPDRCHAPDGVSAAPKTIFEALTFIDSLPRPVTVPCAVEALERPMSIIGSTSPFSAQPAAGDEAPRIFAIYDTLVLSFVADGDGSHVLEFAEERPNARSVKAELKMPVTAELVFTEAFEHLEMETGSVCGSCHKNEQPAWDIKYANAFESQALRPTPNDVVDLYTIFEQAEACDEETTPDRCEIYDALFYRGEIEDGDFPRPLPTIFD